MMAMTEIGGKRKLEDGADVAIAGASGEKVGSGRVAGVDDANDGNATGALTKKASSNPSKRGAAGGSSTPGTLRRSTKTGGGGAGGGGASKPTAKGKALKKADIPEDTYDDDYFDLPKMMKLESSHVSRLTEDQMKRYEHYRRADLKKEKIKKLLSAMNMIPAATPPSDPLIISVKGLAKIFVGEMVEHSLDIQKKWGESGPLHPKHLREAYRQMNRSGGIPSPKSKPDFPLGR